MNFLVLSLIFAILGGGSFFLAGSETINENASLLLSFQAVVIAAVLVRLNRGVPSLDWKSVNPEATRRLLDRLEDVARVYTVVVTVAIIAVILLLWVKLSKDFVFPLKAVLTEIAVALFGASLGLIISRMAYVVWLDLDIVRLQRAVILSAADADDRKRQAAIASEKLAHIEANRLRSSGSTGEELR